MEIVTSEPTSPRIAARASSGVGDRSSPGDRARLHHTPVVMKGVSGTIPGTDPLGALLAEAIHS